jgi:hypothetical protein
MVITLDAELEAALNEMARRVGIAPETLALDILRHHLPKPARPAKQLAKPVQPAVPQDEWERRLFEAATDCGVSPPDSALSREELCDL